MDRHAVFQVGLLLRSRRIKAGRGKVELGRDMEKALNKQGWLDFLEVTAFEGMKN